MFYWIVQEASHAIPSRAQIVAGQNGSGTSATKSGSVADSGQASPVDAAQQTGLTAGTAYELAWVWYDGSAESSVVSTAFTTVFDASVGAATAAGQTSSISLGLTVNATAGAATAAGQAASISLGLTVNAAVGAATAAGQAASISLGSGVPVLTEAIADSVGGFAVTPQVAFTGSATSGAYYWIVQLETHPIPSDAQIVSGLAGDGSAATGSGSVAASGQSSPVSGTRLTGLSKARLYELAWVYYDGVSSYSNVASVGFRTNYTCDIADATAAGQPASISLGLTVDATVGAATAAGQAASVSLGSLYDPHIEYVKFAVLFNDADGTTTPSVLIGPAVTRYGSAVVSNDYQHFGANTYKNTAADKESSFRSASTITIGEAEDFTIEAWAYKSGGTGGYRHIVQYGSSLTNRANIGVYNGKLTVYLEGGAGNILTFSAADDFPSDQWVKTSASKVGNSLYLFQDQVLVGTGDATGKGLLPSSSGAVCIGTQQYSPGPVLTDEWIGYADDARVTGVGRFTDDILPDLQPLVFGRQCSCGIGAAIAGGQTASISLGTTVNATVGAATAAGQTANLSFGATINALVGAATAEGRAAAISLGRTIDAAIAAATAEGQAAAISLGRTIDAAIAAATATGRDATISLGSGGTGATAQEIWSYVMSNGYTAEENVVLILEYLNELHLIHGLRNGLPLTVTATSRDAGVVAQTIDNVAGTVTVTRT